MPLGIGRSLLSRYESVGGGGGAGAAYYWTDEQSPTSANKARYILGKGSKPMATSSECSIVSWFRCSNYTDAGVIWSSTVGINPPDTYLEWFLLGIFAGRIQLHTKHSGNAMTALFVGNYDGTKYPDVFDGEWHCLMLYKDANTQNNSNPNISSPGDASWDGGAYTSTSGITLSGSNGTDNYTYTNYQVYNTQSVRTMNEIEQLNFGFRDLTSKTPSNLTNADGPMVGTTFDIGPQWIYDKKIDFSQQSVRDYYWDATQPDGYVDGGTDGTAGGAEQPAIYMYHDGTDWKNGGTKFNSTATLVTKGTGSITATDTDGPGTGAIG
jgi:hypothetical protein